MASQEIIDDAINGHQVTIFSKTYCPYCKRAKGLFAQEYKDAEVKILELDELEEGSAIQDALEKMTGQRSVPNIFINKKHVGGCDKVVSLHSQGKVSGLLSA
ncbi:glutaredoxin [Stereum hirsutum FP-91666 SS1]|uniref:glutaredoxin n=1 Tax=Stereum hirsutum (strain FP-91666) TaxID=721885 RepID=UPI000440CA16|nr:glutaredoxin [Stereum hirsutum FP-91666 SS1]EIM92414.1 glutaredoxin [Stereum hirsutum FP-91666 SS1]